MPGGQEGRRRVALDRGWVRVLPAAVKQHGLLWLDQAELNGSLKPICGFYWNSFSFHPPTSPLQLILSLQLQKKTLILFYLEHILYLKHYFFNFLFVRFKLFLFFCCFPARLFAAEAVFAFVLFAYLTNISRGAESGARLQLKSRWPPQLGGLYLHRLGQWAEVWLVVADTAADQRVKGFFFWFYKSVTFWSGRRYTFLLVSPSAVSFLLFLPRFLLSSTLPVLPPSAPIDFVLVNLKQQERGGQR